MFHAIKKSWLSASKLSTSDVKELIPEFFYFPEFLTNGNHLDFGKPSSDSQEIDHVQLPPWAKGNPREFVRRHRQALESEYVSAYLHQWIDLCFGYKQQGPAAEEALNVFYYLTYAGQVDFDTITDPVMRQATMEQIRNFGQTPMNLFTKPHPPRRAMAATGRLFCLPARVECTQELVYPYPIGAIVEAGDRVVAVRPSQTIEDSKAQYFAAWGFADGTVRTGVINNSPGTVGAGNWENKFSRVYRGMHDGLVRVVRWTGTQEVRAGNSGTLVTGGNDGTVCVWLSDQQGCFQFAGCLTGHCQPVVCLAVSEGMRVVVSGSEDSTVIVWDLNRFHKLRQFHLDPSESILAVDINRVTGDMLLCTRSRLHLVDINGKYLARLPEVKEPDNPTSLDFTSAAISDCFGYEMADSCNMIVTGHEDGSVKVWYIELQLVDSIHVASKEGNLSGPDSSARNDADRDKATPKANIDNGKDASPQQYQWQFKLVQELHRHKTEVTAVAFAADNNSMWTGDANGDVFQWTVQAPPTEMQLQQIPCACNSSRSAKKTVRIAHTKCSHCSTVVCTFCMLEHYRTHDPSSDLPESEDDDEDDEIVPEKKFFSKDYAVSKASNVKDEIRSQDSN